jgi:hypothetical protein
MRYLIEWSTPPLIAVEADSQEEANSKAQFFIELFNELMSNSGLILSRPELAAPFSRTKSDASQIH